MMQLLVERLFSTKKILLLFALIVLIGAFLRFYRLSELMQFYADPGWFYWSAKQLLVDHQIPLVGIASSHPWIHQGALWTYVLAAILNLFNFNPYVPAYFVALLGTFTIFLIYFVSKEMFSEKVGIISAFIYATAPIVVQESRLSYHTSPIPTVVILFMFSVFKWIKGDKRFFPICMFLVGIIYNLEIATFTVIGTFILILIFGILKRKNWIKFLLNKRTIIFSVIGITVPMLPMILYDINHGFPQTIKFVIWAFYRIAVLVGYPPIHDKVGGETWGTFAKYNLDIIKNMIFLPSALVSLVILIFIFVLFIILKYRKWINKKFELPDILLLLFVLIPTLAFLSQKTNSGAYLSMLFPQWIILIGYVACYLMTNQIKALLISLSIIIIGFSNSYLLISNDYFVTTNINTYFSTIKQIVKIADNNKFNIIAKGPGSQYESFVMPYKYVAWYLGYPASKSNEKLKFYVSEYPGRIILEVKN